MLVSRIGIASVVLFVALPVIGARSPESASVVGTQDAFSAAASVPGVWFVHTATSANIGPHYTCIDHPLTNNNPNAIILVTANWNPGGMGNTYDNHSIGVAYSTVEYKWVIFHEDQAAMPIGAAFNVLIPDASAGVFVHEATVSNTSYSWTTIDHPRTNDNPNAIVLVTQNANPGGAGYIYNDHSIGMYYSSAEKKWVIYNQDLDSMPIGAAFNVLIPPTDSAAFVHKATASTITDNWTTIDHPLTNDNPNAIVLVTQNKSPGGVEGPPFDHPIGVWYYSSVGKWAVFNQDLANMPEDAAFNVLIPATDSSAFVHTATVANISGSHTYFDHPLTNDNPNAILFVTQNWNPGGVGSTLRPTSYSPALG